jgi:hypothetical protein
MSSESARANSTAESRFRIDYPNSCPRAVKVMALDRPSNATVERLARDHWNGATFLTTSAFSAERQGGQFSMQAWLSDLSGRTKYLLDEVEGSDLVVMIASAGESVPAAAIIGQACSLKRVATTALVLDDASVSDQARSLTLSQLRPWALMLVVANSEACVADMLRALRA